MIYAPLFVVLRELLSPALLGGATVVSAALAGGVGAAFYGARHLALAASLVGVASAMLLLLALGPQTPPWVVVASAAVLGLGVGVTVEFPNRCTVNMGRKFTTGFVVGGLSGGLLVVAEGISGRSLPLAASVAFLVSVTGVIYVAALNRIRRPTMRGRGRFCNLTEGVAIAVIAVLVAGSIVAFFGIFADGPPGQLTAALLQSADRVPIGLLGGMLAGVVTGGLLELFRFGWVDRD
jgi:hypothetical protein